MMHSYSRLLHTGLPRRYIISQKITLKNGSASNAESKISDQSPTVRNVDSSRFITLIPGVTWYSGNVALFCLPTSDLFLQGELKIEVVMSAFVMVDVVWLVRKLKYVSDVVYNILMHELHQNIHKELFKERTDFLWRTFHIELFKRTIGLNITYK